MSRTIRGVLLGVWGLLVGYVLEVFGCGSVWVGCWLS